MATHSTLYTHDAELKLTGASGSEVTGVSLLRRLAAWYTLKIHAERDAEIVAFIEERGGQFNDAMEREISRRFGGMAG
jgi:hypothetical protein